MRLFCKTAFLAAIVSALACHDSVAPTLPAGYILDRVNGQSVPYVSPISENPTIVSGALLLQSDGLATLIQRRQQMGTDVTDTTTYRYTINGTEIGFVFDCGPAALCATAAEGTIVGGRITLNTGLALNGFTYEFQFSAPD